MNAKYDFKGLTTQELVLLQHKARQFPQDKDFVNAILIELGRRDKDNEKTIDASARMAYDDYEEFLREEEDEGTD